MGAPPPERLRHLTPEPMPHPPQPPLVTPGNSEAAHISEIDGVPPGYIHIHTSLPSAQLFNLDAYAKNRERDTEFNPDFLTDEGISPG